MSASPSPSAQSIAKQSVDKTPFTVWLFFALAWLMGGWFIYDSLHQRITGDYVRIGGQLGPWARLVSAVGLDPASLVWLFLILGHAFIAASFTVYLRRRWGYHLALVASALSLLYLGFGTPLALICLILLLVKPTRRYVTEGG